MKKLFAVLLHPWTLPLLGLIALALVVCIVGPLVSIGSWRPLEARASQFVLIALVAGIYLAVKLIGWLRARKQNRAVVAALSADQGSAAEGSEVKLLRGRFEEALAALRDRRLQRKEGFWSALSWKYGRRYLYELPWYVIVGAPGSGKTTALLNSGLQFPLAERFGAGSIKGVGGTRNCDWWFADQAVLIDTAGRYTTHDSDPEADRKAWEGFLTLLKNSRPRRPLNGLLVTVSVADLLLFTAAQRAEHAATLRRRVDELQQKLGLRLPVYLFVTKCDLLAGFMDYFADGDKLERGQPWGFTFDDARSQTGAVGERFGPEFDLLTRRLLNGVVDRVQAERNRDRRARIYGFPQQFGGLRSVLGEVVSVLAASSAFSVAPLVRGCYFISGTQEGTPLDRMMGALARDLRIDRGLLPSNRSTGRSFFLSQVLSDIVFAEAELVGTNLAWERRRVALIWSTYAFAAVACVLLLMGWTVSFFKNRAEIDAFAGRVAGLRALVSQTPAPDRDAGGTDLPAVLPVLGAAAALTQEDDAVGWSRGLGLYQGEKLRDAAEHAYQGMLRDGLLPRLALRIEQLMRDSALNPVLQYESLKAYVMLHSQDHFDRDSLLKFVSWDINNNLADRLTPDQRDAANGHAGVLFSLADIASHAAEDDQLVGRVRDNLARTDLAGRIYGRLQLLSSRSGLPCFTISRYAGPNAELVFALPAAHESVCDGVDGFYSFKGYHDYFNKNLEEVTVQLAGEESWVLGTGDRATQAVDALKAPAVAAQVRSLYLDDYILKWSQFLRNVHLVKPAGLEQARQQAELLVAQKNPLIMLTLAMIRETTLVIPPDQQDLLDKAKSKVAGLVQSGQNKLDVLLGAGSAKSPAQSEGPPEQKVDRYFAALHEMVKDPGGDAPATLAPEVVQAIRMAHDFLSKAAEAAAARTPMPSNDAVREISSQAALIPDPMMQALLTNLSKNSVNISMAGGGQIISTDLKEDISQFCHRAVDNRFPFVRSSVSDIPDEDFASLFRPGGRFDDFFAKKDLGQFVDISTHPWSYRRIFGSSIGSDPTTLKQFERAAAIRDAFFPNGARTPSLQLKFTPVDMDSSIVQFTLEVDDEKVTWQHGPRFATSVDWPGGKRTGQVSVSMSLADKRQLRYTVEPTGTWALFHLLYAMKVDGNPRTPESFRVTFRIRDGAGEGPDATFDVVSGSVNNPFTLPELRDFRCPDHL